MAVSIYNSGNMISSGLIISGSVISGRNNFMEITSGGSAFDTTVNFRGNVYTENGGSAVRTTVNSMGNLIVENAVADSSVINTMGQLIVDDKGIINHTTVNGGKVYLYDACTANYSILQNGGALSLEGGSAFNTKVNDRGILLLSSGGFANNTHINSGGIGAVYEDAVISGTTISDGALSVSSGGTAINTTVFSGGHIYLENNCLLQNLDIRYGGTLHILESDENATIGGALTVAGKIIAENEVNGNFLLVWKLENILPAESPFIEGLDHFHTTKYSVMVNNDQAEGTYHLADGFTSLPQDFCISIGNGSDSCGTLTPLAPSISVNDKTYTLSWQNSNDLYLTITGKQTQNTNLLQNNLSQVVAWDAQQGIITYLATDGKSTPEWVELTHLAEHETDTWSVVAAGHFKGSSVTQDGLLFFNKDINLLAAWTDLQDPDQGYVELYRTDGKVTVNGLANLNSNEYDDVLLTNENGSFGVLYDGTTWYSICDEPETLQLIGAGNFGAADGMDSLLVKNTADNSYSLWHNSDPATQNWTQSSLGSWDDDWSVAAIGDFLGDGTNDIILWQKSTGVLYALDDGIASVKRSIGTLDQDHWEIAAVGDYNGDGQEDLLLRELVTGRGRLAYWASGNADNWMDLDTAVATGTGNQFNIIA